MGIHHAALHLERVGEFIVFHGERRRQEDEALHLLVVREVLLEHFDAFPHHFIDERVAAKFLAAVANDLMLGGKLSEQLIVRHDEGGDEFVLVGHNHSLLNVAVYHEFRLYHLRGDVFPVGGFEQVFDTLGEE